MIQSRLYEKLGYKTIEHGIWECANGVIQIYEIMEKSLNVDENMRLRPYKAAGFKEIDMEQEIIIDMFGEKWKIIEMEI